MQDQDFRLTSDVIAIKKEMLKKTYTSIPIFSSAFQQNKVTSLTILNSCCDLEKVTQCLSASGVPSHSFAVKIQLKRLLNVVIFVKCLRCHLAYSFVLFFPQNSLPHPHSFLERERKYFASPCHPFLDGR